MTALLIISMPPYIQHLPTSDFIPSPSPQFPPIPCPSPWQPPFYFLFYEFSKATTLMLSFSCYQSPSFQIRDQKRAVLKIFLLAGSLVCPLPTKENKVNETLGGFCLLSWAQALLAGNPRKFRAEIAVSHKEENRG